MRRLPLTSLGLAIAAAATVTAFAAAAQAQDVAAARLAWADRHEALVCEPLRRDGEWRRAVACRERVALVRAEAGRDGEVTGSIAPLPPEAPRRSRCAGIRCIEMLSFPGAAY